VVELTIVWGVFVLSKIRNKVFIKKV